MSLEQQLLERANGVCELCSDSDTLTAFDVNPSNHELEKTILLCKNCRSQIENPQTMDSNHWHCLNDSMWSTEPAVQVMAYRILKQISHEGWPQDLLDTLYLEDEVQTWADLETTQDEDEKVEPTRDSNGTILEAGDTIAIIKDLVVKGAGFTAKQGTTVKNISLTRNSEQIEGRVNGTKIVLLSKFLKKL
jgi:protein PhnA